MSLTASMWTSVSGLLAHGEKMNVIGNNISNVNTVGYKSQRMDFQDFVYQYVGTAGGMGQVGRGTSIGAIMNDFSQGALETTTSDTDIAIQGNGFFCVKPKTNNTSYYTRAGNFSFDREGYLVDPHGYVLQGWAVDRNYAAQNTSNGRNTKGIVGSGSPVDIKLDTFTCPPRHTTNMSMPMNLDNKKIKSEDDKSSDPTDPFFALLKQWDATQEVPLGSSKYAHQSTMEVFDEAGKMHKLTVYFDRVVNGNGDQKIDGNSTNEDYWEFIVTMDPSEDMRDFSSEWDPTGLSPTNPNVPEKLKGLLGAGTLTFSSTGTLKDMSFFVPQTDPAVNSGAWWDAGGNVDLGNFVAAPISSNGFPMISPNFSGTGGLQNAYGYDDSGNIITNSPNVNGDGRMIAVDLGLKLKKNEWAFVTTNNPPPVAPTDYKSLGGPVNAQNVPIGKDGKPLDVGSVWDPAALTSPVPVTDSSGNALTLYRVTADPDTSATVPYYTTTEPTDPAVMYTNEGALMQQDPKTVYGGGPGGLVTASAVGASKYRINGMDGFGESQPNTITSYEGGFYEHNGFKQDGYTYGDLRYVNVSSDGVLSAAYSNGVTLQLFQLTLHDFPSNQNLRREGGNLFTETRESGVPSSGAAGTGTFGTTHGRSLEQSNADLSREFVNMITTQRGFQANSKTITTVDTMLETVIAMKR